jgi:hypothetical protein
LSVGRVLILFVFIMQPRPPLHRNPPSGRRVESARAAVRLGRARLQSPFAPGRGIAFARVEGRGLEAIGIREGDHVALARDLDIAGPEVAAVVGEDGTSALWACTREGARLRIGLGEPAVGPSDADVSSPKGPSTGPPCPATGTGGPRGTATVSRLTSRHARVQGVVVAVLRREG